MVDDNHIKGLDDAYVWVMIYNEIRRQLDNMMLEHKMTLPIFSRMKWV
jgi:hypothetical protein